MDSPRKKPEQISKHTSFGIELRFESIILIALRMYQINVHYFCLIRPSAGDGWWLCHLLSVAYFVNCWRLQKSTTFEYKFSAILTFGLALQTECIHLNYKIKSRILQFGIYSIAPIATCLLLKVLLNQGKLISIKSLTNRNRLWYFSDAIFSAFCGVISTLSYFALFMFVLRKMPKSFTYGEASVVVQGLVIFLANLYFKLVVILAMPTHCMEDGNEICSIVSHKSSWMQHSMHFSEMERLATILQVILHIKQIVNMNISSHSFHFRLVCWA